MGGRRHFVFNADGLSTVGPRLPNGRTIPVHDGGISGADAHRVGGTDIARRQGSVAAHALFGAQRPARFGPGAGASVDGEWTRAAANMTMTQS